MKNANHYLFNARTDHANIGVSNKDFDKGLREFRKLAMNMDGNAEYSLHVINSHGETERVVVDYNPWKENQVAPKV